MTTTPDPLAGATGVPGGMTVPAAELALVVLADGRAAHFRAPGGFSVEPTGALLLKDWVGDDRPGVAVIAPGAWLAASLVDPEHPTAPRGLLAVKAPPEAAPVRKRIETDDSGRITAVIEEPPGA